jgi:hypothetical protein
MFRRKRALWSALYSARGQIGPWPHWLVRPRDIFLNHPIVGSCRDLKSSRQHVENCLLFWCFDTFWGQNLHENHAFQHPVHTWHTSPSTALLYSAVTGPVEIGLIHMRATASTGGSKPRLYCHRSTQYIVHLCMRRCSCQRGTNTIALLCLLCSFSTRYPSHVSWG